MGYFTDEDFDLLAKWKDKEYDKTNKELVEIRTKKLEPIKTKLNVLAEDVTKNAIRNGFLSVALVNFDTFLYIV